MGFSFGLWGKVGERNGHVAAPRALCCSLTTCCTQVSSHKTHLTGLFSKAINFEIFCKLCVFVQRLGQERAVRYTVTLCRGLCDIQWHCAEVCAIHSDTVQRAVRYTVTLCRGLCDIQWHCEEGCAIYSDTVQTSQYISSDVCQLSGFFRHEQHRPHL
jgi:hypothetical protein